MVYKILLGMFYVRGMGGLIFGGRDCSSCCIISSGASALPSTLSCEPQSIIPGNCLFIILGHHRYVFPLKPEALNAYRFPKIHQTPRTLRQEQTLYIFTSRHASSFAHCFPKPIGALHKIPAGHDFWRNSTRQQLAPLRASVCYTQNGWESIL